jgi:hypothetical protein
MTDEDNWIELAIGVLTDNIIVENGVVYRFLNHDEMVEEGDQVLLEDGSSDNVWDLSVNTGRPQSIGMKYRRRIKKL